MLIRWLTGNQPGRVDFVAQDYGESMVMTGAAEEYRDEATPAVPAPEPEPAPEPAPPPEMVPTAEDTAPPSIQMDAP